MHSNPSQSSFLSGEWSEEAQGRIDDPRWAASLAQSRNAIIGEDGSFHRRSGTQRLWNLHYCRDQIFRLTRSDGLPILAAFGAINGAQGGLMLFAPAGLIDPSFYLLGGAPFLSRYMWHPYCSEYLNVTSITKDPEGYAVFNLGVAPANGQLQLRDNIVVYMNNGTVSADTYPQLANYMFQAQSGRYLSGDTQTYLMDPVTNDKVKFSTLTSGQGAAQLWLGHVWQGYGPIFRNFSVTQPATKGETFAEYVKEFKVVQADNDVAYVFSLHAPPWILTFAPRQTIYFQNAGFVADASGVFVGTDGPYSDPPEGNSATGNGSIALSGSGGQYTLTISDGSYAFRSSANPAFATIVGLDVGRAIRCWSQPPTWLAGTNYSVGQFVTYPRGQQGAFWVCQVAGAGNIPGALIEESNGVVIPAWFPAPQAAGWIYGHIQTVNNSTTATARMFAVPSGNGQTPDQLIAQNGATFQTYQLGLYYGPDPAIAANNGPEIRGAFPTCGLYHEGRLWMSGAQPNRIDGSMVSGDAVNTYTPAWGSPPKSLGVQPIPQFSPTDAFGNVLDSSAIAVTLESERQEIINWLTVDHMGILGGTLDTEWLLFASALNDPLTPTSIQAHAVSHYGSLTVPPIYPGIAHVFIQRYGKLVEELMVDVFSQRFSARPLNEMALHLTASQVIQLAYHETPSPLIWALMADGTIACCTYRRKSYFVSEEPLYMAWCSQRLGLQTSPPNPWTQPVHQVNAITTTPLPEFNLRSVFTPPGGFGGLTVYQAAEPTVWAGPTFPTVQPSTVAETLAMLTEYHDAATNTRQGHLEVMRPLFGPFDTLNQAWFLDGAISGGSWQWNDNLGPAAPTLFGLMTNTGVQFYGLRQLAGYTVEAHVMGMDLGAFLVASDGSVTIPWQGNFTQANVELYAMGRAQNQPTDFFGSMGCPIGTAGQAPAYNIPAVFGFPFSTTGQRPREQRAAVLRLSEGDGFGKTRKQWMVGAYVIKSLQVSFGVDNQTPAPAKSFLQPDGTVPMITNTAPGIGYAPFPQPQLQTKILWETVDGDTNFDQQITWTVSGLAPLTLGGISQFMEANER